MNRKELRGLVDYLAKKVKCGYKIVTWNGLGFDFDILAEESGMLDKCRSLAIDQVDMMFHAVCRLGYGISCLQRFETEPLYRRKIEPPWADSILSSFLRL